MGKTIQVPIEDINKICELYLQGVSRRQIRLQLGYGDKVIQRILEENAIHIRNIQEANISKYKINQQYFELDKQSHNTAYILGMLASDGCVAGKENCIYIELQRCDREILEKINKEIENERPVKDYDTKSGYSNSKLYFFSRKIKEDLAQYNIIPNKTQYNNDFLQNINEKYQIDYIRGHFDGDGCIKMTGHSITWQIDSSSFITLQHIQKVLSSYGIETKIVKKDDKSIVNLDMYRIYCYGKEKCQKIYDLFYELPSTVTLRMERKYKHFTELLLK